MPVNDDILINVMVGIANKHLKDLGRIQKISRDLKISVDFDNIVLCSRR